MIKNAEFFFEGGRTGVLLIHGLTGTPNEMKLLGKGLHNAGFTVLGMQLAGHCGDVEDLLATGWRDWYHSVELAAAQLLARTDRIFIGGLSMGAVLSLMYAAQHPARVLGVGVYGATFRYDGWSIPYYARNLGFLLNWLQPLGLFRNRVFIEQPPYGLKDERLRALVSQSMLSGDSVAAGLAGNPWPSLAQMNSLSRHTRRLLPKVTAPCLIMHASHDDISHIDNARLVARSVNGPVHMVPLDNSYHMITIDQERNKVIRESIDFIHHIEQETAAFTAPVSNVREFKPKARL